MLLHAASLPAVAHDDPESLPLRQPAQRLVVGPRDQLAQIRGRHAAHIDDGHPVESRHVARGLDALHRRQLQEASRIDAHTEPPALGLARFEVREGIAADLIAQHVYRRHMPLRGHARQAAAVCFDGGGIHAGDGSGFAMLRRA